MLQFLIVTATPSWSEGTVPLPACPWHSLPSSVFQLFLCSCSPTLASQDPEEGASQHCRPALMGYFRLMPTSCTHPRGTWYTFSADWIRVNLRVMPFDCRDPITHRVKQFNPFSLPSGHLLLCPTTVTLVGQETDHSSHRPFLDSLRPPQELETAGPQCPGGLPRHTRGPN